MKAAKVFTTLAVAGSVMLGAMFTLQARQIFNDPEVSVYGASPLSSLMNGELVVHKARGGSIPVYLAWVEMVRFSGANVRLEGMCYSACTFYLSLREAGRVCATKDAVIGVHTPVNVVTGKTADGAVEFMELYYNSNGMSDIVDFVYENGGWKHTDILYKAPATDFVKECDDA